MSYQAVNPHSVALNTTPLHERGQCEKATFFKLPITCHLGKGKSIETTEQEGLWLPMVRGEAGAWSPACWLLGVLSILNGSKQSLLTKHTHTYIRI